MSEPARLDLAAIGERLSAHGNRDYWRSLEELAETPEFRDYLEREFPRQASEWDDGVDRRGFLKLMAASLTLAGATGCLFRQPEEQIVPYVEQPEEIVPGRPLWFATAMPWCGYGQGLLVESREGRPIKIEGNPEHPASLGATDIFGQASLLELYDPDRSKTVMQRGNIDTWDHFLRALGDELAPVRTARGAGLAILTEPTTSPTLTAQLNDLLAALPEARWHAYQPAGRDNAQRGAELALGRALDTIYQFERADVILALDAEFLFGMPGSVRYAREFIDARRVASAGPRMNRLYAIESAPTLTGSVADHRFAVRASDVEQVARLLARELGVEIGPVHGDLPAGLPQAAFDAIIGDLEAHAGRALVVVGDGQPPEVHALAHAMNRALEGVGTTLRYIEPVAAPAAAGLRSLSELAEGLAGGSVQALVMLGGNPVYNAPAELQFGERLSRALGIGDSPRLSPLRLCVHLSDYYNETSLLAHWHVPAAHYLESWSDVRAFDGTATILQPLIAPLYEGKTAHELVAALAGETGLSGFEIIERYWQTQFREDFGRTWRRALHDGLVANSASPPAKADWQFADRQSAPAASTQPPAADALEIIFQPDYTIWDGRCANNGWLQELPKPLTKLTWDNAALVGPATAEELGLAAQDVVRLSVGGRSVDAAVWLLPGMPPRSVAVSLGYGRTHSGRVGTGLGYDAYRILPAGPAWFASGASLKRLGETFPLVATHQHWSMEGRDLVRSVSLADYKPGVERIEAAAKEEAEQPSLYPGFEYPLNAWGMVIDTTACIGCNACIVACQAENNTPIVGKHQVAMSREMHWLRVDRYYQGDYGNPQTSFQPVPCMHCEDAPCELVCPVAATVHDAEGLNNMVYNRCVGTRYCSNNCPYKVRRFNFLEFTKYENPALKMLQNPEVTVRSRGVMEKCSYCVQRISAARIEAKKAERPIRDGEVQTACQGVCPTRAITFGNINDSRAAVTRLKQSPLNYALLGELNTRPRTTYLARVRNPHPDLMSSEPLRDLPQLPEGPPRQREGGSA